MVAGCRVGWNRGTGFAGAALLLGVTTAAATLLLLPYAVRQTGANGPAGLLLAAALCLGCGLAAEGAALAAGRGVNPLTGLLLGIAIRMAPPLVLCLLLVAQGADGRRQLAFIVYLLTFYGVTLMAETWLSVSRHQRRDNGSR